MTTLRWLFVLAVAAAVIPNGSVERGFYYANCISFGLLLAACAFVRVERRRQRQLVVTSLALLVLSVGYALLQALPLQDHPFANPAWSDVIALGLTDRGSISVAPGETLADLPSLAVPLMALAVGIVLHQDDEAAQALWIRLGTLAGVLAIIALIRHELFPDAELFGSRPSGGGVLAGHFFNRNIAAAFFALGGVATLGMVLMYVSQMRWASVVQRFATFDYLSDPKYRLSVLGGVLFLGCLTALATTQSRAGVFLGFVCLGGAAIVIAAAQIKTFKTPLSRLGLVFGALLVGGLAFLVLGGRAIVRVDQDGFDDLRLCAAQATLRAIQDYPLFGTGYSTFKEVFPIYRSIGCGIDGVWEQAHNSWLEGYLGFGFPFLVFVGLGLWAFTRAVLYGYRVRQRLRFIPVLAVAGLAYVSLHSLVDFPLHVTGVAVYFAALVAAGLTISTAR